MSGDHNKHAFEGMTIDASEPIKTKFPDWPESAFPSTYKSLDPETQQIHRWGMQLRDYFAAKAMHALMTSGTYSGIVGINNYEHNRAKDAYKMADAMIKARGE